MSVSPTGLSPRFSRSAARNAGAPQDYSGPMAKPHRMFVVTVTALVCAIVSPAWPPALFENGGGWPVVGLTVIVAGSVVTAVRRLLRAGRFLLKSGAGSSGAMP